MEHALPGVGRAAVSCLERLGCGIEVPAGQTCCGQPAYNAGYAEEARAAAARFVRLFAAVKGPILSLSGSCAAFVRELHPVLLGEGDEVREVAARVEELTLFIERHLGDGSFALPPERRRLALHSPCHAERSFGAGGAAARILCRCGADLPALEYGADCCGFGGVFSVKFPEVSSAMGRCKLREAEALGADALVSPEASCLLHLRGLARREGSRVPVLHLVELLAGEAP